MQYQPPAQGPPYQYPPPPAPPPPAPTKTSGLSNKRVLGLIAGLGCLGLLAIGAFIAMLVFGIMGGMKKSDAYETAHRYFTTNATVVADLGTPIEDGMFPSGSINTAGAGGHADLTLSLSGPKGEGSAHMTATRTAAGWTIYGAEWTFNGKVNVLMAPPAGIPAPTP